MVLKKREGKEAYCAVTQCVKGKQGTESMSPDSLLMTFIGCNAGGIWHLQNPSSPSLMLWLGLSAFPNVRWGGGSLGDFCLHFTVCISSHRNSQNIQSITSVVEHVATDYGSTLTKKWIGCDLLGCNFQ